MKKSIKFLIMIAVFMIVLFVGMSAVNAAVEVTRNVYSNDGSMKFEFKGLELDTTKEYEYALTNTTAETPSKWFTITEYTATTATIDVSMGTTELRNAFNVSDTGYITIREKSSGTKILDPYKVDLKLPYMRLTNFAVINNGKEFGISESDCIIVPLRNKGNSKAYYQFEKIKDENVISKYKEIKKNDGDYLELQNYIKEIVPTSNWTSWGYFNGYGNGFGYPKYPLNAPATGLYYMWIYFSGENLKPLYGVILVDNLEPDIALEGVSIQKTLTIKLGETSTITPTFTPEKATNKIVTWTSSDENVATVSNAGVVTAKNLGSTIITVTSQDGNKTATCTVTVTNETSENNGSTSGSGSSDEDGSGNNGSASDSSSGSKSESYSSSSDSGSSSSSKSSSFNSTSKPKTLPKTGTGISLIVVMLAIAGVSVFTYKKINLYKGIK